jgi:hypothetical protein
MDPPKHPNAFEHMEKYLPFILYFILYGCIGGLIGRVLDHMVASFQKKKDRFHAVIFIVLQIALNGTAFYILFKTMKFKRLSIEMTFDDWLSSTFQGLIFATTFYSVQTALTTNFQILIKTQE